MDVKILKSNTIYHSGVFEAKAEAYQLPSGKTVGEYFYIDLPDCVIAFCISVDEKVLLVKQYRHAVGKMSLEIPGGFIDPNEEPEIAVRREILEETGCECDELVSLGATYANPGILTNKTYMFLAKGCKKVANQDLDAGEEIEPIEISIEELKQQIANDEMLQSMHELCIMRGLQKLKLD